jgi:two-component system, sensor histidine kinase and response regulator
MARVVFVNDEVDLVDLCTLTLEEAGHEAYGFTDANRALEAMLQMPPDVIILDWVMRDRKADEVLRKLRREPTLSRLPVLIVSALPDGEERARLYGANAFLAKPFTVDGLLRAVQSLLPEPDRAEPGPPSRIEER